MPADQTIEPKTSVPRFCFRAAEVAAAQLWLHVQRHTVPVGVPLAGERQVGLQMALDGVV